MINVKFADGQYDAFVKSYCLKAGLPDYSYRERIKDIRKATKKDMVYYGRKMYNANNEFKNTYKIPNIGMSQQMLCIILRDFIMKSYEKNKARRTKQ